MLKNNKNIYIARVVLLLALAFGAGAQQLRAQGYYTLTNGHYYWFDGRESDPDDSKYLTGFQKTSNGWKGIYNFGTHASSGTTEIVEQGTMYLALDTAHNGHTPANPGIEIISTDGGFNPLCVWYRKGKTELYYQEWNGYRYYLYGDHSDDPNATDLSIIRIAVDQEVAQQSVWYDWDHGAAITKEVQLPGGGSKESYYWLIYDDLDDATGDPATEPCWRMSKVSCYQRPEEMMYVNYHADGLGGNTWDGFTDPDQGITYYDNVRVDNTLNYPAGVAATFMPVTKIEHPTAIASGRFLTKLTRYEDGTDDPDLNKQTFAYGETYLTVDPIFSEGNITMQTTPAYTEYVEETYRRGINLYNAARTSETFGSAGVPTVRRHFYYRQYVSEEAGFSGDITSSSDAPGARPCRTSVDDFRYSLDSRATRYLEIVPAEGRKCYLRFKDKPVKNNDVYLTFTVYYKNGTFESITDTIHITVSHDNVIAHSKNAPVVKGSLFGGARMANVQGNTSIIVHNTDSIYALYGGNDVAGWVQGDEGATVQIGTRFTNADHPVHIGWVYGGGCGYYTYQGLNIANVNGTPVDPYVYNSGKSNLEYQAYFFNGKVYKWNSVPSDYESHASQVVERYTQEAATPGTWLDEEIMEGYYSAAWEEDSLVVDQVFSYVPYYYCDESTHNASITPGENASSVDNTEDGNGSSCMADKSYLGTVPYIKTAHVMVGMPEVEGHNDEFGHNAHEHNDYILIDSLFGGAENAFIGVTTNDNDYASAITVDINGGTILALFGGNNYGGSIAKTAMTLVNIHCTKLTDDENLVWNSFYHGMGRDQGIRHVFGGGNMVDSPHAQVSFLGGMVDTAYIGGNMATVENPVGIVNCQNNGKVYDIDGRYLGNAGTAGFMNGHFIYTNPTLEDTTFDGLRDASKNKSYIPDNGLYNVHFLFGGNNQADMNNVSFVQLLSGGVGAVLGGGNKGSMTNDKTTEEAVADHRGYIDITPLLTTMDSSLALSTLVSTPNKISAVVAASKRSKIIADYVHGGCRQSNVKNSCGVYLAGGSYYDIFAGNDVSGDVGSENDGATYAVITGQAVIHANVYGGNDGYYHCNDGTGHYAKNVMSMDQFNPDHDYDPYGEMWGLLLPTQKHANVFVDGGLIKGDLVAGGVMANIGFSGDNSSRALILDSINPEGEKVERAMRGTKLLKNGTVRLEIAGNAEIRGNVFGGGANASVFGLSQVFVHGSPTIHGNLFAGNDCIGQVQSFLPYQGNMEDPKQPYSYFKYFYTTVKPRDFADSVIATTHTDSVRFLARRMTHIDSLTVESLNQASQLSSNGDSLNFYTTTVDGIKQYNPKYSTYVLIEGTPVINSVYGSGNGAWNYDGTHPEFPSTYICEGQGGNRPNQESAFIDIHTSGGFIDTVFGGGAGSTVTDKVLVLLNNVTNSNPSYPASLPAGFKGGRSTNFVGTIFGGNDFSEMAVVPKIQLVKGNVKNVYGGGNKGNMSGSSTVYNICDNPVSNVSTYIVSSSENVTVTDSVFGGCRMSDIEGMAYVEVQATSPSGIQYLYGGNDISGNVKGNTRIDMSGGLVKRIWGGSNGRYDFVPVGYELFNVYPYSFSGYDAAHPEHGLIATSGKPHVDSTNINLWGGTVGASVFTGGSMSDCRTTCLVVDDMKETKDEGCPAFSEDITINGAIYGGGEGRWDDLNARDFNGSRWGNVNGSTHVHLYHAENVTAAMAYGGGGGGDVQNTFITTYDTWDNPFYALYGGCWGSDVYGTAHLEFNGKNLVRSLYGGNDFTGNVYRSEMVVNSGRFYNVYGGGNGDYPDSYYTSQHASALLPEFAYQHARPDAYDTTYNRNIERPNTEYVHITFNNGEVDSCLYGGGRLGTVLPYAKNEDSTYRYQLYDTTANGIDDGDLARFIPDTMRVAVAGQYDEDHNELTVANPEDFSYIVVNVHGGKFHRNVFGGGRGSKKNKKPIVYGLKVVNMDGGEIYESLYGGSEFVNDGYPAECKAPTGSNPSRADRLAVTTMRPSSIVNITGGTVGANFYGAGYQGMVYGSSYVNVGQDAIDSCTVWRNIYGTGTADSTYKMFKPGYKDGQSDTLRVKKLLFRNSLYSGANWGLATGATTFDNPGFVGGENRLYIDGKGYNTTNDHVTTKPEMNIVRSLYGSGTSVLGGDIHSHIELRNYGGMEDCHPTRTIETIQRTDSLWMHNSAILLSGTTDASQQYLTNRYALTNIGHANYRGYNVTEFQAAVSKVGTLGFYEQGSGSSESTLHTTEKFDTVLVPLSDINVDATGSTSCGDSIENLCLKEYMVSPSDPDLRHTLLVLNKGIDFTIGTTMSNGDGAVKGFGFMVTPGFFQSTVTARPKMELTGDFNKDDGGFVSSCPGSNQTRTYTDYSNLNPAWGLNDGYQATDEMRYTNHAYTSASGFTDATKFRVWKAGDKHGLRETEATLLAHTQPKKLTQDWSENILCGVSGHTSQRQLAIAEAVFTLPATSAGHYYKLTDAGFELSGNNGQIVLVDSAWSPNNLTANTIINSGANVNMDNAMSSIGNTYSPATANTAGSWKLASGVDATEREGVDYIHRNPEYTFGLVMVPNNNFMVSGGQFDMPSTFTEDKANLVISGNARVNNDADYCSPKVYNNTTSPEIKPSMRLYLTYDTTFAETFVGTVTFTMMEYDTLGREVAPIKVTVYIQTIIDELKDVEENVLAMYNGGRTNTFTRKIELPPVGEERNLYITGIKWLPTNMNGEDTTLAACSTAFGNTDRFSLLGDSSLVWATSADYPRTPAIGHPGNYNHNSHNRFALTIIPSNNVSGEMNTANGWIRGNGERTNLYKLAYPTGDGATPVKTLTWNSTTSTVDTITLRSEANYNRGYFLGTLDGRGTAVLDVELTFDGERVYDRILGKGYVGKAVLSLESFADEDGSSRGTFHITVYVKTREHGDTIYLATADHVTRQLAPNKSVTVNHYDPQSNHPPVGQSSEIGKRPKYYVQTFRKALEEAIYQEGDVIAIIDEVDITTPVHISGSNGPAIEVIRYDGHHHDLPDEQSVYRGPMIVVSNGGLFTAQNIDFHGGAGAKIKHILRKAGTGVYEGQQVADLDNENNLKFATSYTIDDTPYIMDKAPDTNMAFGPIIQVTGVNSSTHEASRVILREGTIVEHNWNEYGSLGGQTDDKNMGAISVTNGATLTLSGNVTVENNLGHTLTGYDDLATHDSVAVQHAPGNGAIYVDGGTMELATSNPNTAVTITNNYLMNPAVHSGSISWWTTYKVNGKPERYFLAPSVLKNWHKANVLLTRKKTSATPYYNQVMNDSQSDVIVISGTVGDSTKIGVRKWFPGIHDRDTIQFAVAKGGVNALVEKAVVDNKNFTSDDHFRVFYNSLVNLSTAYLFRCATFRHQSASEDYIASVYNRYNGLVIEPGAVLHFGVKDNVCPMGGDSLIYRIQGGLMPYTYTWSDTTKTITFSETTTPYSNAQVEYDMVSTSLSVAERTAKYVASMADTLLLPKEAVSPNTNRKWNHLLVTATDATGECKLHKEIDLRIFMDHNATAPVTYWPKASGVADTASHTDNSSPWRNDTVGTGWTDTTRTVHAIASRNFKGVQITPRVWVDRTAGTISATLPNDSVVYRYNEEEDYHALTNLSFCPGDSIYLYTNQKSNTNYKFIMWDFDPYYRPLALYTVPANDATVTAYYGPNQYWYQHINNMELAGAIYDNHTTYTNRATAGNPSAGMVTTYNGDVHIYNEAGLAWFISCVNGLNNTAARTFHFNRVLIHDKGSAYDMKDYLWTPLGTEQHPFMGRLFGVSNTENDDLPWSSIAYTIEPGTGDTTARDTIWDAPVVIKNIIINEPQMYSTGFFGYLDSAGIYNVEIQGTLVRGSQYVGGLAGISSNSYVRRSAVYDSIEDSRLTSGAKPTSILTTHYVSGGLLGKSTRDEINGAKVQAKFVGDAVYSGGAIGYGTASKVANSYGFNKSHLQGLYLGGIAGYLDGVAPTNPSLIARIFGASKSSGEPSVVQNNYFHITSEGSAQRLGGVVGYAENSILENNYIFGDLNASHVGGVTGVASDGTQADHNYYSAKSASQATYRTMGNASLGLTSDFEGGGNQVILSNAAYGTDNLTRALNKWVREHNAQGGSFNTWRSDLDGVNSGYPLFGTPDLIPANGVVTVEGCGSVTFDGVDYASDSVVTIHVIDYDEMVDSTQTTYIVVHPLSATSVSDSATAGVDYEGYGFTVSATESALLRSTIDSLGFATLVLTDTLSNQYGCDSVITLTLTFSDYNTVTEVEQGSKVNVYPNPTTSWITVDAEQMSHVEVYDNEGRRLQDYDAHGRGTLRIDLSYYASGIYYIRIHTPYNVVIHKVIKR